MRTARRSLVFAFALVISVVATPAYAGDDSPGLLDTLGATVDSLEPIQPKPTAEPAPAAPADKVVAAEPASATTVVQTLSSSVSGVKTVVVDTLGSSPLAPVLDPVLGLVAPNVEVPTAVTPEQGLGELINSLDLLGEARFASSFTWSATESDLLALSSSLANESGDAAVEAVAQTSHVPGTSTLPDGGTSLTVTWLMLWAGAVAAGALIVRRSRTAS